jgi:RimJ/RimL family protein N-acetyltransferase
MADNKLTPVFLRGKKTVMRPVLESDLPYLMKWANDPDVREFIVLYLPQMEEGERKWIKNMSEDRSNVVLMMEDQHGNPFGTMGLHRIDLKNRNCQTGALIGEKDHWGQGYGTDAKLHLLQYAFDELGMHRVGSLVHEYNERSLRYSLRCGYKEEGRARQMLFRKGRFWDLISLAIFRPEWEAVWERYNATGSVK